MSLSGIYLDLWRTAQETGQDASRELHGGARFVQQVSGKEFVTVTSYDNPLKWLLRELPSYVPPPQLDVLMTRYNINKHAYVRQVKIRHAERIISLYTRRNDPRDVIMLARWQAKLATLKGETT